MLKLQLKLPEILFELVASGVIGECVSLSQEDPSSSSMTTSQLTVSAIRQHFEAINYLETTEKRSSSGSKHADASKQQPRSDAVTHKKQPPKTRPKPKLAVVVAARAVACEKTPGDVASQSVPAQRQCRTDEHHCWPRDVPCNLSNSASDPSLSLANTRSLLLSRLSGAGSHQMHVDVGSSLTNSAASISRWASAGSLVSDVGPCSTDDVKDAIKRAKQKIVLQRVAGMILEGETRPYETHMDTVDVNTDGKMNELASDASTAADDTSTWPVCTDASLHRGDTPSTSSHESSPHVKHVVVKRSNSNPISTTLPAAANAGEQSGSADTQSASQDMKAVQTRRPTSLYPQDIHVQQPPAPATRRSPTDPALLLRRDALTSAKHSQVSAASRQSYLALEQYVGENFSFLDDIDDTDTVWSDETPAAAAGSSGGDVQQTGDDTLPPTDHHGSTTNHCSTASRHTTQRPKSSLTRRSIILPSGEILEIIGTAFTFLDDYAEQTEDSCVECEDQDFANDPQPDW